MIEEKLSLQIQLCFFRVWVRDSLDTPVFNATVDLDYLPSGTFISDYGLVTDSNGFTQRAVSDGLYNIRVRHPNFETYYENGVYFPPSQTWPSTTYFDRIIHLQPVTTPPPTGKQITFYLVDNDLHRVRRAYVALQNQLQSVTDWDGKVVYLNIPPGTYSVSFSGDTQSWIHFEFTKTVTMPDHDIVYTVYVEDQAPIEQQPPTEPDRPPVIPGQWDWSTIFNWLATNWPIVLVGGGAIIVGWSILTAPKPTQIVIMSGERKK